MAKTTKTTGKEFMPKKMSGSSATSKKLGKPSGKQNATPKAKSTAKKSTTPLHLKELKTESRRVKNLYDPTARPGFKYGKGTM